MKKIFMCLVVMLGFATTDLYAQSEVRGVETKLVIYGGPEYEDWKEVGYRSVQENRNEWFGFEFYNMNGIPVSIDVELCYMDYHYGSQRKNVVTKKTFVLGSQESYIWKFEDNNNFQAYYKGHQRTKPGIWNSNTEYYVEYKAYKLE